MITMRSLPEVGETELTVSPMSPVLWDLKFSTIEDFFTYCRNRQSMLSRFVNRHFIRPLTDVSSLKLIQSELKERRKHHRSQRSHAKIGLNETQKTFVTLMYMITIIHQLLIYTSMKHPLCLVKLLALALDSLDTLSGIRIRAFMLLF
jgi:hypothetical protein